MYLAKNNKILTKVNLIFSQNPKLIEKCSGAKMLGLFCPNTVEKCIRCTLYLDLSVEN